MDLLTLRLVVVIVVAGCDVGCSLAYNREWLDEFSNVQCNSTTDAMNYLHQSLLDNMTFEEKCKRYVVLTSLFSSSSKGPHSRSMSQFLKLTDQNIDQYYRRLNDFDELPVLFMAAIDAYRAESNLGPPFIELIECLKKFDRPYIETYLNDPELVLILDLHKQILQSPGTKINLAKHIEHQHFSPAFVTSLLNLFRNNVIGSSPMNPDPVLGDAVGFHDQDPIPQEDFLEKQKKHLKTWREQRKMVTSHRTRERERLRKHRLKLLQPDVERIKQRERHCRRRDRRRKENEQIYQYLLQDELQPCNQSQSASRLPSASSPPSQASLVQPDEQIVEPDLSQIWSEVAPIYESITSPFGPYELEHRVQLENRSGVDMFTLPAAAEPFKSDSSASSVYKPLQAQTPISPYQPPRPDLMRSVLDMSPATQMLAQQGALKSQRQILLIDPSTPSPLFSSPVNPLGVATPSTSSASGNPDRLNNYFTFDDAPSTLDVHPALPPLDQFDDIEFILQSIPEISATQTDISGEGHSESDHDYRRG